MIKICWMQYCGYGMHSWSYLVLLKCLSKVAEVLNFMFLGLFYSFAWSLFFQVEHMLNDRLLQFVNIDLHEVKVCFCCLQSLSPLVLLHYLFICFPKREKIARHVVSECGAQFSKKDSISKMLKVCRIEKDWRGNNTIYY